ncbi:visual pigment-like receptor peropsin [Dreissena polymorpha]|uniref:visual pigment-like receptor peropsin n=1 Tax=Dreissena polymorpha TaxID=45954 RepID=UPI002263AD69|nr:visual pigment-like receptor peropsin [Dreissena polymorpha]
MLNLTSAFDSPRWIEITSGLWILLLFALAIALNGLTMGVYVKYPKMVNVTSFFTVAIITNGLLSSALGYIPVIIAEFSGHWLVHMSEDSCIAEALIVYYFGCSSMFLHVCIAYIRYQGIVALPTSNAPVEKWRVALAFGACQLLSLVLAVSPLLGLGAYGLEAHGTSCGLAWNDRSRAGLGYLILIGTVCYVFPVTFMCVCYVQIVKTVHQSSVRVIPASSEAMIKRRRKQIHLVKISLGLVLAFVVSWTPYAIVSFYTVFANPHALDPILTRSAAWLAKTEVIWNPLVYALLDKSFRRKMEKLMSSNRNLQGHTCKENGTGGGVD